MEGLIAIFAEAIVGLLVPLISAAFSALAGLVSLAIELITTVVLAILHRREVGRIPSPTPAPAPAPPRRPRRWRPVAIVLAIVAGLVLVTVVVVELFFDEALVRWALKRHGERTGLRIEPTTVDASLWRGRITLGGVAIAKAGDGLSCDVAVQRVSVSASLWSMLGGRARIDELAVEGLRGRVASRIGLPRPGPRKRFVIGAVAVRDLVLDLDVAAGARNVAGPLVIERAEMAPVDSEGLVFDLLFRSNLNGSYLGSPIAIASGPEGDGRITTWRAEALPVSVLAVHLGPPWDVLQSGVVDVVVDDRWNLGEPRVIDVDYRLRFRDLVVAADGEAGAVSRGFATALDRLVRANGGVLDLHGTLRVDGERFSGALSLDAQVVGRLLLDAALDGSGLSDQERAAVKALLPAAKEWARDVLERWRTKKKL